MRGEWEDRDSLVESVVSLVCWTDLVVPEPDDAVAGVDLDVPVHCRVGCISCKAR